MYIGFCYLNRVVLLVDDSGSTIDGWGLDERSSMIDEYGLMHDTNDTREPPDCLYDIPADYWYKVVMEQCNVK